jgi:predicted ATPase
MHSIRSSVEDVRLARWDNKSRQSPTFKLASKKRVEAASDICMDSCSGWLARLQADAGNPETALSTIDEAFGHINDVAGRAWEAELHRLRGDILQMARPDGVEEVEGSYKSAICVAQRQCARSFELRANVSLTRLLQRQGRSNEARRLLGSAYACFTEGFGTADLKEAKALLESLG